MDISYLRDQTGGNFTILKTISYPSDLGRKDVMVMRIAHVTLMRIAHAQVPTQGMPLHHSVQLSI